MLLKDKVAIITGAASGVGRAAARIFAQNGARIVCADVVEAANADTARQVTEAGGSAIAMRCDVTREEDVRALVQGAVENFGRLDIMFNNAGVATATDGKSHKMHEQTLDDFERLTNINFRGVYLGCRFAIEQFLKQGDRQGVIVNTGSVAGMVGWGGTIYGATKGAVIQMTRGLAIELAPQGIRVNAVCPAGMITSFGQAAHGERAATQDEIAAYGGRHPLGMPIAPEDCANAALFLASDMARNITGVALPVDGGYIAG